MHLATENTLILYHEITKSLWLINVYKSREFSECYQCIRIISIAT